MIAAKQAAAVGKSKTKMIDCVTRRMHRLQSPAISFYKVSIDQKMIDFQICIPFRIQRVGFIAVKRARRAVYPFCIDRCTTSLFEELRSGRMVRMGVP